MFFACYVIVQCHCLATSWSLFKQAKQIIENEQHKWTTKRCWHLRKSKWQQHKQCGNNNGVQEKENNGIRTKTWKKTSEGVVYIEGVKQETKTLLNNVTFTLKP